MKTPLAVLFFIALLSSNFSSAQTDTSEQEIIEIRETATETDEKPIFMVVEEMPEFPGGPEAMMKFIGKNVQYPDSAKELGIEGRVIAQFVIDTAGNLTDIKILRGIGYGCDEEVVRVLKAMPKWKPGKQRGKAVRVRYNLPVKFQLEGDTPKPKKKKRRRLFRSRD